MAEPETGIGNASLPYAVILLGLVLGVGGTAWGLHFWRTMHSAGNSIAITGPTDHEASIDLGVSIYSPSMPMSPDGNSYVLHMKKGNTDSARAEIETYDSVDKVLEYYQNEMGPQAITKRGLLGTTVSLNKDSVAGSDNIIVTLVEYVPNHNTVLKTKTLIHISHIKTAAAS
jgi:hypothetical protein